LYFFNKIGKKHFKENLFLKIYLKVFLEKMNFQGKPF